MSILVTPKSIVLSDSTLPGGGCLERARALELHNLRTKLPAILLGLSDPAPNVRLAAARRLGEVCEATFLSQGLPGAVEFLNGVMERSQIFFNQKDPRMVGAPVFDAERAKLNVRLGVLMAIQAIARNVDSPLRTPLATFFAKNGLFEEIKVARESHSVVAECLARRGEPPPFHSTPSEPLQYVNALFTYAVAVSAVHSTHLKKKFFPEIPVAHEELSRYTGLRTGILDTLANVGVAAIEVESSPRKAAEMRAELKQVVGAIIGIDYLGVAALRGRHAPQNRSS